MARSRIKSGDTERIQSKLRALPGQLTQPIKEELAKSGGVIERSAKRRAPKLTGALRQGITTAIIKGGFGILISAMRQATKGRTPFNIAWFVDYGTTKMKARPFLTVAYRTTRKSATRRIGRRVRQVLNMVSKGRR
jgi:HK97 gp10 family phage protein